MWMSIRPGVIQLAGNVDSLDARSQVDGSARPDDAAALDEQGQARDDAVGQDDAAVDQRRPAADACQPSVHATSIRVTQLQSA